MYRSPPLPSPKWATARNSSLVLAAHYRKPWPILAGAPLATLANHALAGIVGVWFGKFLPLTLLDFVVGASMIAMALWVLKPDALDGSDPANRRGGFVATLIAFFIAEIGDKTQIATAALAAGYFDLCAVVAGTTCGMLLASAPVVFLGKAFVACLPQKAIHYSASCLFAVLGAVFIMRALMHQMADSPETGTKQVLKSDANVRLTAVPIIRGRNHEGQLRLDLSRLTGLA